MRCGLAALLLILPVATAVAAITFSEPTEIAAGQLPIAVASADLNGDSTLDLIVVNRTSDDAYVYLGDGSGGFQFFQSFAVGNFPQGVIAVDFDGDDNADLATTAVPFNTGNVNVWLGNGDGTFQLPTVLVTDDGPRSLLAVDIDDNGLLDVIATNATRGNTSFYSGDGDGTFGPEIRTAVGDAGAFPTDLAVADFDEDGNLDVVTSNAQSGDNSIGLIRGDGDGTFSQPTAFPTTCTRPESIISGDFDRDQHIDVAVACFFSDDVAVILGNGNGGFANPQLYSLAPGAAEPYWILSDDFDNDGRTDLVTANNGSFAVFRGNGDGTFEAPTIREALPGFFLGATAADLDGDGWTDLAITNPGQNEIWVYLNETASCSGGPCPLFVSLADPSTLDWIAAPDATGYDIVQGSLQVLRANFGNFAAATEACLVDSSSTTTLDVTGDLDPGQGVWFLVRVVLATDVGSYDAFSGNLVDPRDAGIAASGFDCP